MHEEVGGGSPLVAPVHERLPAVLLPDQVPQYLNGTSRCVIRVRVVEQGAEFVEATDGEVRFHWRVPGRG